ncbi:hypothetical protein ABT121_30055 [Streptomyces sp. NPDC001928]|uniref:hypothetical protein n=1 Tax=Streptomyces sp. NPDC001928 TaxID=3154404 RepID=UPI00332D3BE9
MLNYSTAHCSTRLPLVPTDGAHRNGALRGGAEAGGIGPPAQLAHHYLTSHADPESGSGQSEPDQMARPCGSHPDQLPTVLDRLAASGLLEAWRICPNSGDLRWTLAQSVGSLKLPEKI